MRDKIKNMMQNSTFLLYGIISFFLILILILYFVYTSKIIEFFGKHLVGAVIFLGITSVGSIISLIYSSVQKALTWLYILNIVLILFVIALVWRELKIKDSYMVNYLLLSLIYIEIVCICSNFQQDNLIKFITTSAGNETILKYNANEILIIENNANNKINKIFMFLGLLLLFMVLGWIYYYVIIRDVENKIKNIDKIELKIIFLKSVLQSITASIALLGLTGWGLGGRIIIIILFIDAYAAFSYPILDINKYIRQKEKEAFEKNYASIKPNDKFKE